MSRRKLKPEEKELWQQVAQTATPLFGAQTRPLTAEKKFIKIVEAYEMIIKFRKEDPEPEETVMENYPVRRGSV